MCSSRRMIALSVSLVLLAAGAVAVLTSGNASARPAGGKISLVAYSTPREAYGALIPAFQDTAGRQGTSLPAVATEPRASRRARSIAGLKADVVALSLEPDMTSLVKAGLVAQTGRRTPTTASSRTRSSSSRCARATRRTSHLGRPDQARRRRRHAERPTSGGAKWNVMAAYGAQRRIGKSTTRSAVEYLEKLYDHVVSQDKSAREALQTFVARQRRRAPRLRERGDLRAEARPAHRLRDPEGDDPDREPDRGRQDEQEQDHRAAPSSISCGRSRRSASSARTAIARFCARRRGSSASRDRRSCSRSSDLGGWAKVDKRFFDPDTGIVTKIQNEEAAAELVVRRRSPVASGGARREAPAAPGSRWGSRPPT